MEQSGRDDGKESWSFCHECGWFDYLLAEQSSFHYGLYVKEKTMFLQIANIICIILTIIAAIFIILGVIFLGLMILEVIKDDRRKHNKKE